MTRLRRLTNLWINEPRFDYLTTALIGVVVFVTHPALGLRSQDHGTFYQTLAAVNGVLLTLGTIVITLVFTVTPNDRLTTVMQRVGVGLQRLVMQCLGGLVLTTAGFTCLFFLEHGVAARWRVTATAILIGFAASRFGRLWWLLSRVIEALAIGNSDRNEKDNPPWQPPLVKSGDYRVVGRKPDRH